MIRCPICGRDASFETVTMVWRCEPCDVEIETDVEVED